MRDNDKRFDNSQRVKKLVKKELPTIHRQKPWIDTKIVNMTYSHGSNYAVYGLFHDDRPTGKIHDINSNTKDENIWRNTNNACFAGLLSTLYNKANKYNRMYYDIYLKAPTDKKNSTYYNAGSNVKLSIEECIRWIQITKEYKFLPEYVDENLIEISKVPFMIGNNYHAHKAYGKGTVVFDLTGLTQAQLYVYISTLRHLREDAGFVRVALYFIDSLKMNFFAAYVLASRIAMNTTGHHTISTYRTYGSYNKVMDPKTGRYKTTEQSVLSQIEGSEASLHWMIGLQRFIKNPKKYDKDLVYKYNSGFKCNSTISKISKVNTNINIHDALDPDIKKAIMASTDDTSHKYANKFIEKKPRIKYKEAKSEK